MAIKLNLTKINKGHYQVKDNRITITIINAYSVNYGLGPNEWELIISKNKTGNIIHKSFWDTKRDAENCAVDWVINNIK